MKNQITSLILASAVALAFAGCATEHHSTAYDYKIIKGSIQTRMPSGATSLDQKLDQATAEGWQVVSSGSDNGIAFIVLKRAK